MSTPILYKGNVQLGVWKYLVDINLPAVFGCVSNQTGINILNGGFPAIDGAAAACVFTPPVTPMSITFNDDINNNGILSDLELNGNFTTITMNFVDVLPSDIFNLNINDQPPLSAPLSVFGVTQQTSLPVKAPILVRYNSTNTIRFTVIRSGNVIADVSKSVEARGVTFSYPSNINNNRVIGLSEYTPLIPVRMNIHEDDLINQPWTLKVTKANSGILTTESFMNGVVSAQNIADGYVEVSVEAGLLDDLAFSLSFDNSTADRSQTDDKFLSQPPAFQVAGTAIDYVQFMDDTDNDGAINSWTDPSFTPITILLNQLDNLTVEGQILKIAGSFAGYPFGSKQFKQTYTLTTEDITRGYVETQLNAVEGMSFESELHIAVQIAAFDPTGTSQRGYWFAAGVGYSVDLLPALSITLLEDVDDSGVLQPGTYTARISSLIDDGFVNATLNLGIFSYSTVTPSPTDIENGYIDIPLTINRLPEVIFNINAYTNVSGTSERVNRAVTRTYRMAALAAPQG